MIYEEADDIPEILRENTPLEEENNFSLRPNRLSEYIGQEKIVETLRIAIEAALQRKESLDHTV
jgi:Holliday junction resolvasome RuvABC ATP-dependent DNA helicase subunit